MPVGLLFMFSLQTNLKCLASSAPKIWLGPHNVEMVHVTLTTPTWGQLVTRRLIRHVINSCTKFEISSFSPCRDISLSRDHDHAPFRDNLSSCDWDLLPLTYRPKSKFLITHIAKIWEAVQNVQIWEVWGAFGGSLKVVGNVTIR